MDFGQMSTLLAANQGVKQKNLYPNAKDFFAFFLRVFLLYDDQR